MSAVTRRFLFFAYVSFKKVKSAHCVANERDSLPALLLAVGVHAWSTPLAPSTMSLEALHAKLVDDVQWRVRRVLARSLPVVAAIVGSAATERALLPAWQAFLCDVDEVKNGAVLCFTGLDYLFVLFIC